MVTSTTKTKIVNSNEAGGTSVLIYYGDSYDDCSTAVTLMSLRDRVSPKPKYVKYNNVVYEYASNLTDQNGITFYGYELTSKIEYSKGTTSYGKVSSTNSSAYPDNSYSGSYWYVKQGSDSIDPTAVTIPSEIHPGDTITAALTARANTYGGTITYTYSYSVDGGSTWASAGSTTATSLAITVPEDAEQFQVRAVAKDNYGFTSTTYVASANVEVRSGAVLLACIDGVIREITPTVMVDGVLRELSSVPAMIDGVSRELGAG